MLDLSFSTYYGLAKLQIVYVENKYNSIAYIGNIQECSSSLTSAVVLVL